MARLDQEGLEAEPGSDVREDPSLGKAENVTLGGAAIRSGSCWLRKSFQEHSRMPMTIFSRCISGSVPVSFQPGYHQLRFSAHPSDRVG